MRILFSRHPTDRLQKKFWKQTCFVVWTSVLNLIPKKIYYKKRNLPARATNLYHMCSILYYIIRPSVSCISKLVKVHHSLRVLDCQLFFHCKVGRLVEKSLRFQMMFSGHEHETGCDVSDHKLVVSHFCLEEPRDIFELLVIFVSAHEHSQKMHPHFPDFTGMYWVLVTIT